MYCRLLRRRRAWTWQLLNLKLPDHVDVIAFDVPHLVQQNVSVGSFQLLSVYWIYLLNFNVSLFIPAKD